MGIALVLVVVLGCVGYLFFRGTVVESFALMIISICAGIVAFSYYEPLANILIGKKFLINWAQFISFLLLFIVAFSAFQAGASYLTRKPVNFGVLPERIGRVFFGIFSGLLISGFLLTAVAMAPLSPKLPYQRFDLNNPIREQSSSSFLNVDGFATGWFSMISSGSLSSKKSFAVLHPDFLDQIFLDRYEFSGNNFIVVSPIAIKVKKEAVWPAPEDLKDTDGQPVPSKSGHKLMIVRLAITTVISTYGGYFTPGQMKLICKRAGDKNRFSGNAKNIYPLGYLKTPNELEMTRLNTSLGLAPEDYQSERKLREFDFVFYVPDDYIPILIEFKRNVIIELPRPIKYEEAPPMPQPSAPEESGESESENS